MTKRKKSPAPVAETQDILGRAMLVRVHMGVWEARKHDAEVTNKVNDEYASSRDAGRYHKHLFGGSVQELGEVLTAATRIRATHHQHTLPWTDEGWRILPTENYFAYMEAMREAIQHYSDKADVLERKYSKLIEAAKTRLNGMFKESDYPSPRQMRARYYAYLDQTPLPSGSDFRVDLPQAEMARMAQQVDARRTEAIKTAMAEAWQRLGEAIHHLRERLGDGKRLRDTMVEGVREVADILGRLNLTDDAKLEQARMAALRDLATIDVETLRGNEAGLQEKAAAADAILASMKGLYTPPVKKKKEAK